MPEPIKDTLRFHYLVPSCNCAREMQIVGNSIVCIRCGNHYETKEHCVSVKTGQGGTEAARKKGGGV